MSFHGRSLDDQPLAAYSTGVAPEEDEPLDELDAAPADATARPLTQQDIAAALADSTAPAAPPAAIKPRRSFRVPTLKLPNLGGGKKAALEQAAPFRPVPQAAVAPVGPASGFEAVTAPVGQQAAFQAVSQPLGRPVSKPVSKPVKQPKTRSVVVGAGAPAGSRARAPRISLRDPRILAGGAIVIGLGLLGFSLLGGGGPNAGTAGPNNSQDANAVLPTAPALGNAEAELTAGGTGTYTLTGATGSGPAVDSRVDATWTDPTGQSLGLVGMASQGTRATDPNFVLTWTMLVGGSAVTFTSRDAECTVGMAVGVKAVHGTFVCQDLKSPDGKHVISLRGSYTT